MPANPPLASTPLKRVDAHVHIVGDGSGGSGCWLRLKGMWRLFGGFMLRHAGLPASALRRGLDQLYVERLLEMVKGSSLGAIVILAQDLTYDDGGRARPESGRFHVPNDYVLVLAKKHPAFLPAVSIHPARPDALAELERCLGAGAVMMKCLPNCQNINCNDRRFTRFWERMAQAGLPLLAHTGGEHTLPVIRKEYADPRIVTLPLECGVKVIAAHCGTKSGLFDPQYFHVFADMTRRYANLYGDNSAFTVPIRSRRVSDCLNAPLVDRMIHGSDFPVPVHGAFSWLRGRVDWGTYRRWQRQSNVLERDYQLKGAMGFPAETFTRIWGLLRTGTRYGAKFGVAQASEPAVSQASQPADAGNGGEPKRF